MTTFGHASAVPRRINEDGKETVGLTKREYFAAIALQGLLAGHGNDRLTLLGMAKESVKLADLLIEELNSGQ